MDPRLDKEQHRPGRAAGLLLLFGALIVYGTLYPFDFRAVPGHGGWAHVLSDWSLGHSRSDAAANVLLFVPFGFAGSLLWRRAAGDVSRICLFIVCTAALALAVQCFQIYLPSRTPSMGDAAWNLGGALLGLVIGALMPRRRRASLPRLEGASPPALGLLLLWLAVELLPFVPGLDWQQIKDALRPLLLNRQWNPVETLRHAVGAWLAGEAVCALRGRRSIPHVAALLLAVLAGKALVVSQHLSPNSVVGFAAGFVGWLLVSGRPQTTRAMATVVVLLAMVSVAELAPVPARPGISVNWTPFAGLLRDAPLSTLKSAAETLLLYGGILWQVCRTGGRLLPASFALALWVALLEAAQVLVPGRTPDVTEPLWALLAGTAVYALSAVASSRAAPAAAR